MDSYAKWKPSNRAKYNKGKLKNILFEFLEEAFRCAENQEDYPSWRVFVLKKGYNVSGIRNAIKKYADLQELYDEIMATLPELKVKAARIHAKDGDKIMPWQLVKLDLMANHGWSEKAEKTLKGDSEDPLVVEIKREIVGNE